MKAKKPKAEKRTPYANIKPKDLPATRGMLQLVRNELKAEIRGVRSEMKEGFSTFDAKFSNIDSRFHSIESKIEGLTSEVSRLGVLLEEQNANNRIVLEGISGLWQRQDTFETKLKEEVESSVSNLFARIKS